MKIQDVKMNEKETITPSGNWNTAKDWFPIIVVDQTTGIVYVTPFESTGFQYKATVETTSCVVNISKDHKSAFIRGEVDVQNWRNRKCSGSQKFCFAVFEGDSGHIYTHRAPASKIWMTANPETITKRLRKLGIGSNINVIQQGDFLLKPSNGNSYPDSEFKHETMGAGHHKFEIPVLYATGKHGRQYKITEPVRLIHEAIDDIKHPDVIIPVGVYIVGTTSESLKHSNKRD